jgi:hypothetical protein
MITPITQRRLEAAGVMVGCIALYFSRDFSGGMFALYFFTPDLSILAYIKGPRLGAAAYNTVHCYLFPTAIGGYALLNADGLALQVALIWGAHISFDRVVGWGLKYPDSFCNTDLGQRKLPIDIVILR